MHVMLYSSESILGGCGDLKGSVWEYYNATRVYIVANFTFLAIVELRSDTYYYCMVYVKKSPYIIITGNLHPDSHC